MSSLNNQHRKAAFTLDEDSMKIGQFLFNKIPDRLERKLCLLKGIGLNKHNHAFWLIEDTMRILIPAGIPQWTRKFIYEMLFQKFKEEEDKPKVFTVEDFQFGFVIWSVACGISLVAFLMEIFYFYGRSFLGIFAIVKTLKIIE
jgi:hypothetical protein